MGIKRGDLVMVARGHECIVKLFAGVPFIVREVHLDIDHRFWCCSICGGKNMVASHHYVRPFPGRKGRVPIDWLIKIDPPAEQIKREETVRLWDECRV